MKIVVWNVCNQLERGLHLLGDDIDVLIVPECEKPSVELSSRTSNPIWFCPPHRRTRGLGIFSFGKYRVTDVGLPLLNPGMFIPALMVNKTSPMMGFFLFLLVVACHERSLP